MSPHAIPPTDSSAVTDHQIFGAAFPELALGARELIEAGLDRAQVLEALTTAPAVPAWLVDLVGAEADYLLATGAAGRSQRMSTDMPRAA